ncbi:MAG: hypothetical protein M3O30_07165 [Planctomycetota bacterium]|nr:hypothetical protein [Planctomycetota bacterium]
MKFLDRLERSLRDYAIPNLTLYLVCLQLGTFFMSRVRPQIVERMILTHETLLAGQWWRLLSFVIMPISSNPIFAVFAIYMLMMMGTALETQWGAVRYNLFLLVGYLATVLVVFIPGAQVTNAFYTTSILLAFATLYPDYQIMLFFFFPVKMKWIAALVWIGYAVRFLESDLATEAAIAASIANFLLFFHGDIRQWLKAYHRKTKGEIARAQLRGAEREPRHVCAACGINDVTSPRAEFRYCPQCAGTPAYCIEHIHNHVHK